MNPRTCLVSREEKHPDEMIRFVLDGGNVVVPDIKRKLPGRGVWISASRKSVQDATSKEMFSRGFKAEAKASDDLAELVERLLKEAVVSDLSLARKAGLLVTGRANVEDMIRTGAAVVVIHASNAKGDGRRKIDALAGHILHEGSVYEALDSDTFDRITGGANTMHLGLSNGGMSEKAAQRLRKYCDYIAN